MLYVGVDLHRKRSVVAALDDQGDLVLSRRIESRPEEFQRVFGELGRFRSAEELCSWAGLTPTERSSDEHTRRGHISKQGSRWLRWVMVEAATSAVRNPSLRLFYERIERRRGKKIARVALARRLLTLCFYALRDNDGCRAFPVRARARQIRPGALARSHGLPAGDGRSN